MNLADEIRQQIEKNKGLKLAVGEINNHLSILEGLLRNERDDAQKQVDEVYQRGLNDAWECGKKLAWTAKYGGYGERLNDVFGRDDTFDFYDYTPNEAIEKLKAFEQKQDKIEVGDEVEWDNDFTGDRFIVTRIYQPYGKKEQCDGIDDDGDVYRAVLIESLVKTGRHFDIASILEEMRHD